MHKAENNLNLRPLLVFILIIAIWESCDLIFSIKEVILPNPHEILFSIIHNFPALISGTSITMIEALAGLAIGLIIGFMFASAFVFFPTSKDALYPYAIALKATPLFALAPILVVWFGNGMMSKIVMSALISFFPIIVNAVKGLSAIDPHSLLYFKSINAGKWQVFLRLRIPNSLPYIFPALKISASLAIVGATIAEFTGSTMGIGHIIMNSTYYLDTSLVFAAIVMISLSGIILFYFIDFLEKKIVFWQQEE